MDAKTLYDFKSYFKTLAASNKLAHSLGMVCVTCSGIHHIEGLLQEMTREKCMLCITDTTDTNTTLHGGSWVDRRVITVFIVMRYKVGDMSDYSRVMDICRQIYRQFRSRLIIDQDDLSNEMVAIRTDRIPSKELGGTFLNGATGLYFMLSVDEPVDLSYDPEEWQ